MNLSTVLRPDNRPFGLLLCAVLILGIADSMTGSYIVLFGADRARLSPFEIGVFITVSALSGIVMSTWLGRRYDKSPSRVPALLAVGAPAVGYLLLAMTTSYPMLLVIAVAFLGLGAAAFPQLFAMARSQLDARTPTGAERRLPALRSGWSLAWALGPVIGGFVLAQRGFGELFVLAAVAFGTVTLPVLLLGPPRRDSPGERTAQVDLSGPATSDVEQAGRHRPGRIPIVVVISFTLFHIAQFAGAIAMPLYVTQVVNRRAGDVGLLFSVGALVEVPAALGLMLLPGRAATQRLISLAMALFVAYFVMGAVSSSLSSLVLAHTARGAAIAVVGALGISYFQNFAPDRVGYATTLFANTGTVGTLMAGMVAGSACQALGSREALVLCGALSAVALVLFTVTALTGARGDRHRAHVKHPAKAS